MFCYYYMVFGYFNKIKHIIGEYTVTGYPQVNLVSHCSFNILD